jgi:ATP-dependent Lon protease
MYMINTNKLGLDEKKVIAKDYLIPSLCKEVAINKEDILFDDDIIKYIIENYSKEDGVRNLRRTFETILSKLNIIRITQTCNINDLDLPFKIDNFKLPLHINKDIIQNLVELNKTVDDPPFGMYS